MYVYDYIYTKTHTCIYGYIFIWYLLTITPNKYFLHISILSYLMICFRRFLFFSV